MIAGSAAESTGAGVAGRLLRRLRIGELLAGAGWILVVTSVVLLADPVAAVLFAPDGRTFGPEMPRVLGWARLGLGSAGLLLLGTARWGRGLCAPESWLRLGDAFLLGVAAAAGVLVVEGLLRARALRDWGSATRTPLPLEAMRRDPEVLLRPGAYVQTVTSDYDAGYRRVVRLSVNRHGLRGPEPSEPKAPGRVRIVCLGGSTTFGYMVSDGEEWPARLGALLSHRFEVLNGGRPGATTFRDFSYLRDRLLRLEPDVVILYEGFNDLWRAARRHRREQTDYGIVDEGLPATDEPLLLPKPRTWPWRPSFLAYRVGLGVDRSLRDLRRKRGQPDIPAAPLRFDPAIAGIYHTNLRAMVRLCRSRRVTPVVATFAGCDDPSRNEVERKRRLAYVLREVPDLDLAGAEAALDLYRNMTRRVAREEGAPLVDLARLMTKDLRAFTDTVHFTPEGESLLARHVERGLLAPGVLSVEDSSIRVRALP